MLIAVTGNLRSSTSVVFYQLSYSSIGRHTKSLDIDRKRCGHCYGKFEVLLNKQAKGITVQSTPRKATGFALFVKENYATVKAPNLNHGKVMKLLGQKFAELKVTQAKD